MIKKYKTKVSYGMLGTIFLLFFVPIIFAVVENGFNREFYILLAILIPSYTFILYVFFKTEYKIENEILKIKCGILVNKSIDIYSIKKISKTKSLISSPAPSFDRIEIRYGKFDEIIISPADKFSLANDLTLINKGIENNIKK